MRREKERQGEKRREKERQGEMRRDEKKRGEMDEGRQRERVGAEVLFSWREVVLTLNLSTFSFTWEDTTWRKYRRK